MAENERTPKLRLVLITGLSGSGKTSVANAFEDLGYHTVDNLPLPLLEILLAAPAKIVPDQTSLAVVADVRTPGFHEVLPRLWEQLDRERIQPTLIFLEAPDESLVRRFSETRRPHPLAVDRPVIDGIRQERQLLTDLRGLADRVFDTSEWNIHDVRQKINREFADHPAQGGGMFLSITSFGFKHGIPYGTDMLFDVRFLPNPHFVPGLREQTGRDEAVKVFLEEKAEFGELVERLSNLLLYLLPLYQAQDRSYLSVGIGCTGGRHRSVATAVQVGQRLADSGWPAQVLHRDVEK